MQVIIKAVFSIIIIFVATAIGRKIPSAAGLIGVMPLTGTLVLVWLYLENRGDPIIMQRFARGAIWGILPSILFFLVALHCFKRGFSLFIVLILSFTAWAMAALIHQWLLR